MSLRNHAVTFQFLAGPEVTFIVFKYPCIVPGAEVSFALDVPELSSLSAGAVLLNPK
jgi:hypothetical protein